MKFLNLGSAVVAASLLIAAPAFAQSMSPSRAKAAPTARKQKTDSADNPSNAKEYEEAAEWHKGPYDNTANSLGGRHIGGAGGD